MLLTVVLAACSTTQQTANNGAPVTESRTPADPIADKVKASVEIPGLFTVYQDTTNGSTKMLITTVQIGQEFIYWGHSVDGPVAAGHNRGSFRDNKVFSIQRHFDRIEFVVENVRFQFDENNPLSRAANANIARAVLFSGKIEAEDVESGRILINSDPLFLSETMQQSMKRLFC